MEKEERVVEHIIEFAEQIELGDRTNREAHGAKVYFNELMENSYSRGNKDILLNSGLDYGYTILRSYLARLCVGYGLNTQIGIHHKNEYNRFNLVDDLIEPFRPLLDYYAYELLEEADYFTAEHRHALVDFLNRKIRYKEQEMYLCNAMEEYVKSVAGYICGKDCEIEFPTIYGAGGM